MPTVGIPTVGILHSDDQHHHALQDEFVFGAPDFRLSHLVCVSKSLEDQVLKRRAAATQVSRIGYGVPIPQQRVKRRSSVLRLPYVGRLTEEQKRISPVCRALCRVVSEIPGTEAAVYGDGPDRTSVEAILA